MKTLALTLIGFLLSSCTILTGVYDTDPMYSTKAEIFISPLPRVRSENPGYYYSYPNYGLFGWGYSQGYPYTYYRSQTIVITPKETYNYGKRPSREEGNHNPNFRPNRGRRSD